MTSTSQGLSFPAPVRPGHPENSKFINYAAILTVGAPAPVWCSTSIDIIFYGAFYLTVTMRKDTSGIDDGMRHIQAS